MALIKIFENDNFVVDYDKDNGRYRVSYFEDYHFKDDSWFKEYNNICGKRATLSVLDDYCRVPQEIIEDIVDEVCGT